MRNCNECGVKETMEAPFYKGTNNRCRPCTREYAKQYRSRPEIKEREAERGKNRSLEQKQEYRLRFAYGIGLDDYNQMLVEQNYLCAICGTDNPGHNGNRFVVDHDHETGDVRGLLCSPCNTALGLFKDKTETLVSATSYLIAHEKIFSLPKGSVE